VLDPLGEEDKSKPNLKNAEKGKDEPAIDRPCFFQDERDAKSCREEERDEVAFRGVAFLLGAEGDDHHRRGHAAKDGKQVAVEPFGAEFIAEEKRQPDEDDQHGKPVCA